MSFRPPNTYQSRPQVKHNSFRDPRAGLRDANHALLSFQTLRAPEDELLEQMNSDKRKLRTIILFQKWNLSFILSF